MKLIIFVSLSLFVHLGIYTLLNVVGPRKVSTEPILAAPKVSNIKVEIKSKIPSNSNTISKTIPKIRSKSKPKQQSTQASQALDSVGYYQYKDLLPGIDFAFKNNQISQESDTNSGQARYVDLSELEMFGTSLAQRLSFPHSLSEVIKFGQAKLSIKRAQNGWELKRLTGDAYIRAVVHAAFSSIRPEDQMLVLLSRTKFSEVKIVTKFNTFPVSNETVEPMFVSVDKNTIQIVYNNIWTHPAIDMFFAKQDKDGSKWFGVDLFSLAGYLSQLNTSGEGLPLDVRALKYDPAFRKPLFRE